MGFGIQVDGAENAGEPEKVLIFQPGCAAALVHLDTKPVAVAADVGGQVELRGGEGIFTVSHKLSVEPDVSGLFNALEGNTHGFSHEARVQIEFPDIAAYGIILPVNLRRTQVGVAIPGIEFIDVLNLTVTLGFYMPGDGDGAKVRQVISFLPEIFRTGSGIGAPGKAPLSV